MTDYNPDPKGNSQFTGSNAEPPCQNGIVSEQGTQTEVTVTVPGGH